MSRRAMLACLCVFGPLVAFACASLALNPHRQHRVFLIPLVHRACGKPAFYAAHTGSYYPTLCLVHADRSRVREGDMWMCPYCGKAIDPDADLIADLWRADE